MPETRTYADRAEYIKQAVAKRRRKIKAMAVEYKGGACMLCGYNKCASALDFHHIDESSKKFGLGLSGLTRSWVRVKAEVDKCIIVCANCHRELHAGITQLPREIVVE